MKVLLGGTFSILHKAHRIMISRGLQMGELIIGITSDSFDFKKNYNVPPYVERKRRVEGYLKRIGGSAVIRPLDDPVGGTLDPGFDAIVVSNETMGFVSDINFIRKSRGLKPLIVENIGTVLAQDLLPIKSERIMKGVIDPNGRRKSAVKVILGTENEEKLRGASTFLLKTFRNVSVKSSSPGSSFHPQPIGNEVFQGALRRLEGIGEEYDYAIGLEAGIFETTYGAYDFHVAAVMDSLGRTNFGISSGFPIPAEVMRKVKEGLELEDAVSSVFGIKGSGDRFGAVYYMSKGMKKRRDLVVEALQSAFVERISESIPRLPK
ncbi:MAG: pantetheine-phosphate adenylyltransferase [Thermoplasmata archaeon]